MSVLSLVQQLDTQRDLGGVMLRELTGRPLLLRPAPCYWSTITATLLGGIPVFNAVGPVFPSVPIFKKWDCRELVDLPCMFEMD